VRGTNKSTPTLPKAAGYLQSPRKRAKTFALDTCRSAVTGKTNRRFWKHFDALPANAQKLAREKYALWKSRSLTKEVVEFVVSANPDPRHDVASTMANCT